MNNRKINNPLQMAYIRRYTLTDGKESGLKVIEMNNGLIRLLLNESKGLDIMQLWHQGTNISFISKNGFTQRALAFSSRFEGGIHNQYERYSNISTRIRDTFCPTHIP